MADIVNFRVEFHQTHYMAYAIHHNISAQGETQETAIHNLKTAVELFYITKGYPPPRLVSYDVSKSYA